MSLTFLRHSTRRSFDHLPSVPETLDDSVGAKQKRKRSNPRLELLNLRSIVSALETQLSELRQLRRDPETFSADGVLLSSVWEDVVSRQLQLRQDAEIENAKLRATLLEYIRVAKAFERLLRKRNSIELVPAPIAFVRKRNRLYQQKNPLDEEYIMDELSHSLIGMYSHVDVVLRDKRFENSGRNPIRDFGLHPDTSTGTSLEILGRGYSHSISKPQLTRYGGSRIAKRSIRCIIAPMQVNQRLQQTIR
ncbi:hypothetical protein Poli38472_004878 [Pythium oligandrum]|uniref:Uncharacterized protein n=1 Tax=Pythium oligandrum TaxID=41045 RepID=A0A8K1CB48_PYTOL|nr:hypothetical protein Poli38472_004878 [Pythium oligandrum]|eukprot:TMW59809.1 hypothetical protein Poli38472_004878 [Pythium oligandrum]